MAAVSLGTVRMSYVVCGWMRRCQLLGTTLGLFPATKRPRNKPRRLVLKPTGRLSVATGLLTRSSPAQKANEVYMPAVTLILPDPRRTAWRQSVIKGFGDHWGAELQECLIAFSWNATGFNTFFFLRCLGARFNDLTRLACTKGTVF